MLSFASPWQDTSRNLSKVDQMLGEYRDHTDDQAQAMTLVRTLTEPYHSKSSISNSVMLYSLNEGCLF